MRTGLYDALLAERLIVPHREISLPSAPWPKVLEPEKLSFIGYPFEWSFSQLQEAALLTLRIQAMAVEHGASLKDATPYNIQFAAGSPVHIDTLSFEAYREKPWTAYRQFCEMFLAPLAMMAHREADYNRYLLADLAGLRLRTVSRLLPRKTWLDGGLLSHVHLHSLSQEHLEQSKLRRPAVASDSHSAPQSLRMPKAHHLAFVDQLKNTVQKLKPFRAPTSFGRYYEECVHYTDAAEAFKASEIREWVRHESYRTAADLGANNGKYSRILTEAGIRTLALDSDPYCVDENHHLSRRRGDSHMIPLVADLSNLFGGAGWNARERAPLFERFSPDLIMGLAVIHHLRISAGVSMEFLARFFEDKARDLILEFVPKQDPMVRRLLQSREDIFHDYDETSFEAAFGRAFTILRKSPLPQSPRTLYFLRRKT